MQTYSIHTEATTTTTTKTTTTDIRNLLYFVQTDNMEKHEEQNMAVKSKKIHIIVPVNRHQKCGFPFLVHEDGGSPTPKRCANSRNYNVQRKLCPNVHHLFCSAMGRECIQWSESAVTAVGENHIMLKNKLLSLHNIVFASVYISLKSNLCTAQTTQNTT